MPKLELTQAEAELLREIAEEWLSDLRVEIGHTDKLEYREGLKAKEALVKHVLETLSTPALTTSRI